MPSPKLYYAYGIVETPPSTPPDSLTGDSGRELIPITYKDITLIAGIISDFTYTPTPENARSHSQTVTRLGEQFNVIPLRFGTVFKEEEEAVQMLASRYQEIKRIFSQIRNRIELGLKVIWKKECLAAELESRYPELARIKEEIQALPPESAYHSAILLGQRVEEAVLELRSIYTPQILEPLEKTAVNTRLNKPLNERMVLNAAFLVEKEKELLFDEQVNALYERFRERFDFKYSGPWPPYNFVDLESD